MAGTSAEGGGRESPAGGTGEYGEISLAGEERREPTSAGRRRPAHRQTSSKALSAFSVFRVGSTGDGGGGGEEADDGDGGAGGADAGGGSAAGAPDGHAADEANDTAAAAPAGAAPAGAAPAGAGARVVQRAAPEVAPSDSAATRVATTVDGEGTPGVGRTGDPGGAAFPRKSVPESGGSRFGGGGSGAGGRVPSTGSVSGGAASGSAGGGSAPGSSMTLEEMCSRLRQCGAEEIASAMLASTAGLSAGEGGAAVLRLKRSVFERLAAFENARAGRIAAARAVCDPLFAHISAVLAEGSDALARLARFVRERLKLNSDVIQRLKKSHHAGDAGGGRIRHPSLQSLESLAPPPAAAAGGAADGGAAAESGATPGAPASNDSSSHSSGRRSRRGAGGDGPASWLTLLTTATWEREAALTAQLNDKLDSELLQKLALPAATEYDAAAAGWLQSLKTVFSHAKDHERATQKHFAALRKAFAAVERRSEKDGSAAAAATAPKDLWLLEHTYLKAAALSRRHFEKVAAELKAVAAAVVERERIRVAVSRQVTCRYMVLLRDHLGDLAGVLGGVHEEIDPENHGKLRREFLEAAAEKRAAAQGRISGRAKAPDLDRFIHSAPGGGETLAPGAAAAGSACKMTAPTAAATALEQESRGLPAAEEDLREVAPPAAQFAVKKGLVQRNSGLFGTWTDGILVLTWDRTLHMFRSYNDPQPLWSLYMPHIQDVKLAKDTDGGQTIVISEKKNLYIVSGSKSFYIRPVTGDEVASWVRCLELAVSADDLTFCAEGLANAHRADQRAFQEYAAWLSRHETVPEHVLSLDDNEDADGGASGGESDVSS